MQWFFLFLLNKNLKIVKYTKQCLLNHEFVRKVSEDGTCATCICGNKITLKYPFDEDYINWHVEGDGIKERKTPKKLLIFFKLIIHKIICHQ